MRAQVTLFDTFSGRVRDLVQTVYSFALMTSKQCNFGMKEVPGKKCTTYVDAKSSYLSIGGGFIGWKWTDRDQKPPNVSVPEKIYASEIYGNHLTDLSELWSARKKAQGREYTQISLPNHIKSSKTIENHRKFSASALKKFSGR